MSKPEQIKWEESEKVRDLLKKQNSLLGDSLEALDHLIYLQKSINLLSFEKISQMMKEKLPYILPVKYFSFFLFDKDHKRLMLMSHNHPDLTDSLSIHQDDSPIMKEAMESGQIPVDVHISPEQLITDHIEGLIEVPGSLQVMEFGQGQLNLVAVKAVDGGPMIGHEIGDLKKHMPKVDSRVAAIYRDGGSIVPTGQTTIRAGDEVFFISKKGEASKVVNEMRKKEEPYKNIIIAGGGKIGSRLAKRIESNHRVKIIETDHERAKRLSEKLEQTIVLEGNVCDKHLLHEENIEGTDIFAAVTNDDEANVMSCLLAKDMGAHKAVALINNPAYVDLVQDKGIDIAIAPSQITIGTFLAEIEGKDVVKVHSLRRGAAEAIEAVAKNSPTGKESSIGKELGEISLPEGATIGALIRDNKGKIAHDHVHLRENDHVIVFLTDKKAIKQVKETFSPG